jgi:hypothetical protein
VRAQGFREDAVALALRAQDQVAELLDRVHRGVGFDGRPFDAAEGTS